MSKDILIRLLLNSKDFDKNLKSANKSVGGFVDKQKMMEGAGKSVVSMLGKFAGAIGVAMTATEAFKKLMGATQTNTDAFGISMEQTKASVNNFFYSLANGDFNGFVDGLKDVAKYAKEAYKALDDLGTFNIFKDANVAEINEKMDKLKTSISSGTTYEENEDGTIEVRKLTKEEVEKAKADLEQLGKDYVQLINQTKQKEMKAYQDVVNKILKENKFKGDEKDMIEAAEYYLKNYKSYDEATKELAKLNDQIKKKQKSEDTYSAVGAGGLRVKTGTVSVDTEESLRIKNSERYNKLMAITQIGDDNLREAFSHRVNAAAAGSELNRTILANERKIQKGSGGSGKGDGIVAVEGSLSDLNKQLSEAQKQLDAMVYGTDAWEQQKAKVEELTNAVASLKSEIASYDVSNDSMMFDPMAFVEQAVDERNAIEIPISYVPIDEEGWIGEEYAAQLQTLKENFEKYADSVKKEMAEVGDAISATSSLFGNLGDVVGGTMGDNIKAIGQLLQASQQMIPVIESLKISKWGEAEADMAVTAAEAGESVASVPLAGPALAIAAISAILGMVSAVKAISFAEGGVIGGNNYTDGINARISSGEVVFNQKDAKNLYEAVHSGNIGGGGGAARLDCETIWIGLNNHLSRTGKGQILLG